MSGELLPHLDDPVPVFPLPGLVMFPRAVQFLHMFEKRYRQMCEHVLEREADRRLIAMAHLRPGYQAKYHTNWADIDSTVCVSLVVEQEQLDDGRYNLLIRGLCQAQIRREIRDGAYRLGWLEGLRESLPPCDPSVQERLLKEFREAVHLPAFEHLPCGKFCRDLLDSDLDVGAMTDLLAFHLLPPEQDAVKQLMLEELKAESRAEILLREMRSFGRKLEVSARSCDGWPPSDCAN